MAGLVTEPFKVQDLANSDAEPGTNNPFRIERDSLAETAVATPIGMVSM